MTNIGRKQHMGFLEWSLLFLLSAIWGCSFFFFKVMLTELPPLTIVLGRVGLAALILNAWLLLRGDFPYTARGMWKHYLVMGLLNNVIPFTLIVFGETKIPSGLASILNATTPIFAVLSAHFLTPNEKLTPAKMTGVILGFIGVATLIGPNIFGPHHGGNLIGEIACLLAAFAYALAGIYGRKFKGHAPIKVATGQITASALVMIPLSAFVDQPWTLAMPSLNIWGALFGLAMLCTVAAYILYFRILAAAGATNLLLVTFLIPVSALLLGSFALGESIAPRAFGGMAVIGFGLVCIDGRLPARSRKPASIASMNGKGGSFLAKRNSKGVITEPSVGKSRP